METKKKLLYEPPVMEVFEIKTEVILQVSKTRNYILDQNDPFSNEDPQTQP